MPVGDSMGGRFGEQVNMDEGQMQEEGGDRGGMVMYTKTHKIHKNYLHTQQFHFFISNVVNKQLVLILCKS